MYSTVAMTGFLYTRSAKQWVERWFWNPKGLWNDGEAGFQLQPEKIAPKFACQKTMAFVVRLIYVMFCALKLCSEKQNDLKHQNPSHLFVECKKIGGSFSILDTTSNPSVFQLREFCFRSSGSAPLWKSSCTILSAELNQILQGGKTSDFFLGGWKKIEKM